MLHWSVKKVICIVDTGDFRMKVPEDRRRAPYDPYVGKQVIFGLRPEHIYQAEFAAPNIVPAPFEAMVEVVGIVGP